MGRRPGWMSVPQLVGLAVPAAHDAALDAGVLAVLTPPDGPHGLVVTAQKPPAGNRLRYGGRVRIWADLDDPGGGGNAVIPFDPAPLDPAGTKPLP